MAFDTAAAWDLAAVVGAGVAFSYSLSLYRVFRGGRMSRGYEFGLLAFLVIEAGFAVKFILDLEGVETVQAFGFSVRNFVVLIALGLMVLSLRDLSQFWRGQKN